MDRVRQHLLLPPLECVEEPDHDEIVVIGSCMTPPDSIFNESDESLQSVLSEIRLNLKTGQSTKRSILNTSDQINLEAGMVNRNQVEKFIYGDEKFGGEPFFVPNENGSEEDDGYILTYVHDEKAGKSELLIVNAATMEMEASVKLPSRVPYGFHGTSLASRIGEAGVVK
ncbi:hypothetical protein SASPL_156452 [Salvia splendens]|uniref:9-cis-epoxycarotenoid dioxygenase n=1 Tax=Salvia splendens TaxID=180675 RepID=A0A8X8VWV4_SALSN|nr:hypothetical protein SASPL_156452 [Salvia splendens]